MDFAAAHACMPCRIEALKMGSRFKRRETFSSPSPWAGGQSISKGIDHRLPRREQNSKNRLPSIARQSGDFCCTFSGRASERASERERERERGRDGGRETGKGMKSFRERSERATDLKDAISPKFLRRESKAWRGKAACCKVLPYSQAGLDLAYPCTCAPVSSATNEHIFLLWVAFL